MRVNGIMLGVVALLATANLAVAAEPGPSNVQVRNEFGVPVGADIAGVDALALAVDRVRTGTLARTDDSRQWTIVVGAGTYGDATIPEPNLLITPTPGAQPVVSGAGAFNATAGGGISIAASNVVVDGLTFRKQTASAVKVTSGAGVVLRNIVIEQVASNGFEIVGSQSVAIQNPTVTAAAKDAVNFYRTSGPGPYRVEGGVLRQSGRDGVYLRQDARNVQLAGVRIEGNAGYGIESQSVGSADFTADGVQVIRNGNGVVFGGGAFRHAIVNSDVIGNLGSGIILGRGTGFTLRDLRFDGTNMGGDVRFSNDVRAGGAYGPLALFDTPVLLAGEPRGVIVASSPPSQRVGLSPLPPNAASLNRFVRLRDLGAPNTSIVTLRFLLTQAELAAAQSGSIQVHEEDRLGNGLIWQAMPGTLVDPGGAVQITLMDGQIASGSDTRYATYAPLGIINNAPVVRVLGPRPNATFVGRRVGLAVNVSDDQALDVRQQVLVIDGRPVGRSVTSGRVVRWTTPLLAPGRHGAVVTITDAGGKQTSARWVFRVVNGPPTINAASALPGPGDVIGARRLVVLRVPLKDDLSPRTLRVRVRLDGFALNAKNIGGYATARLAFLSPGVHRVTVTATDRSGRTTQRSWRFRVGGR